MLGGVPIRGVKGELLDKAYSKSLDEL